MEHLGFEFCELGHEVPQIAAIKKFKLLEHEYAEEVEHPN